MTTTTGTLQFANFTELSTQWILFPAVEDQGKGAKMQCMENTDEIVLVHRVNNDTTNLEEAEFATILSILRQASCPLRVMTVAADHHSSSSSSSRTRSEVQEDEKDEAVRVESQTETKEPQVSTMNDLAVGKQQQQQQVENRPSSCTQQQQQQQHVDDTDKDDDDAVQDEKKERDDGDDNDVRHDGPPQRETEELSFAATSSSNSNNLVSPRWGDFSSWTRTVRETSKQLATEAANSLAAAARQQQPSPPLPDDSHLPLRLYMQSTTGSFVPLSADKERVTSSSLLVARQSPAEPAPALCTFQWYASSGSGDWKVLDGATHAAFQPGATEVGRRLQCRIQLSNDDDYDEPVCCETRTVHATTTLFTGTRQALVAGQQQFAGVQGRGRAAGRYFRLQVSMRAVGIKKDYRSTCAMTIINEDKQVAVLGVSARSSACSPREFCLILPELVDWLEPLVENNRELLLSAPNRLGRESILLAIGIANFAGKPSMLNESSVLFPHVAASSEEEQAETTTVNNETQPSPTHPHCPKMRGSSEAASTSSVATSIASTPSVESICSSNGSSIEVDNLVRSLKKQLQQKDQIMADQRRQLREQAVALQASSEKTTGLQHDLESSRNKVQSLTESLSRAELQLSSHESTLKELRQRNERRGCEIAQLRDEQSQEKTDLEKTVRTLQNEKAVLTAAVDAREIKLAKMQELQAELDKTNERLGQHTSLQDEFHKLKAQYQSLTKRFDELTAANTSLQETNEQSDVAKKKVEEKLARESAKISSHQSEIETLQMRNQKLKAERNSYKQKCDSLSKEIANVCKNGRSIRDVEKILADDVTRRQEVHLLREQKQKALEELEHYRQSYEQSRMVQQMAGMDHDAATVLERNAELERLLAELTEYVSAKEMQLETTKQVNDALQVEIRDLARANMQANDI